MVARTVLTKRQDEAVNRIEAHAKSIAGDNPEIVEAAQRIRNVSNRPDENHGRVFRLEAIADLMERIDELTQGQGQKVEPEEKPPAQPPAQPQVKTRAKTRTTTKAKK